MDDQSDLIWGVYCRPINHNGFPQFLKEPPMTFDDALAMAQRFAEANKQWSYTVANIMEYESYV
jgi:hypothetical protein